MAPAAQQAPEQASVEGVEQDGRAAEEVFIAPQVTTTVIFMLVFIFFMAFFNLRLDPRIS